MREALLFSASLRLHDSPSQAVVQGWVDQVMCIVELTPLRDALVGTLGVHWSAAGRQSMAM